MKHQETFFHYLYLTICSTGCGDAHLVWAERVFHSWFRLFMKICEVFLIKENVFVLPYGPLSLMIQQCLKPDLLSHNMLGVTSTEYRSIVHRFIR